MKNHNTIMKEATGVDLIMLISGAINVLHNSNRCASGARMQPTESPMKKPKRTRTSECNKLFQKTVVARRSIKVFVVSKTDGKIKSASSAWEMISQTASQKIMADVLRIKRRSPALFIIEGIRGLLFADACGRRIKKNVIELLKCLCHFLSCDQNDCAIKIGES